MVDGNMITLFYTRFFTSKHKDDLADGLKKTAHDKTGVHNSNHYSVMVQNSYMR